MEPRRLALFFVLTAGILIGWDLLSRKILPPPPQRTPAAAASTPLTESLRDSNAAAPRTDGSATAVPGKVEAGPAASAAQPLVAQAPATTGAATPVAAIQDTEARELVVSGGFFTARLSNRGGDLVSFTLSDQTDDDKKPLELVRKGAPFPGRTLTLDPADAFLIRASRALHQVSHETIGLETHVRFHYREADGSGVAREYVFGPARVFSTRVTREGAGKSLVGLALGPGIGLSSVADLHSSYTKPGSGVAISATGSATRKAKDGLEEPLPLGPGVLAAGLESNYFVAAFLPKPGVVTTMRPVALKAEKGVETETEVVVSGQESLETQVYIGPKHLDTLEAIDPKLGKLVDYGMFGIIVRPLLFVLRSIHAWAGNWGVAIILITILIKLALFPLTHKQLVSMKKMSAVQPKLQAIQAKWQPKIKQDPNNRLKMQEEVMKVYRDEGMNPASGCIPILLQTPILFAFYRLLASTIELRHQPFILWIHDLSAKDPYYVTPILMTIAMWVQQQLSPPVGDPAMRRVMTIMPFMFGFFFKDVPSGLVLYWLVQNILTIIQQLLLDRFTDLGPKGVAQRAAAAQKAK